MTARWMQAGWWRTMIPISIRVFSRLERSSEIGLSSPLANDMLAEDDNARCPDMANHRTLPTTAVISVPAFWISRTMNKKTDPTGKLCQAQQQRKKWIQKLITAFALKGALSIDFATLLWAIRFRASEFIIVYSACAGWNVFGRDAMTETKMNRSNRIGLPFETNQPRTAWLRKARIASGYTVSAHPFPLEPPLPLPLRLSPSASLALYRRNCTEVAPETSSAQQLLVPSPPTSEQPEYNMESKKTPIHNLDDDSLLQIFSCYRLED
ncbi:hypothetical protein DFH94DRAFT_678633 [Russula ochroleuca]|uniref:Uncharacterized protein n=1 Tax=Russula ochroleuca TaxID=152965 RepID=A0A9P5TD73_9AGAM|nr:hypothetical protein DFH94DRAFT_678633 [Russula ochroleuca]